MIYVAEVIAVGAVFFLLLCLLALVAAAAIAAATKQADLDRIRPDLLWLQVNAEERDYLL